MGQSEYNERPIRAQPKLGVRQVTVVRTQWLTGGCFVVSAAAHLGARRGIPKLYLDTLHRRNYKNH